MRLLPSAAHVTHKSADLSCTLWCNYKVPPRCGNTRGRGTEGGSSHAPRRIREMAVGRPRGKNGAVPLYLYDPRIKRKRYVGSFSSVEEARVAESKARLQLQLVPDRVEDATPDPGDWRARLTEDELTACEAAISRGEQLVYFIQGVNGGPIKIGMALDPVERLRVIQAYSPVQLVFRWVTTGGQQAEAKYHQRFRRDRLWGEWFEPASDLLTLCRVDKIQSESSSLRRIRMDRDRLRIRLDVLEKAAAEAHSALAQASMCEIARAAAGAAQETQQPEEAENG
jgi:hypothetical protein